MTNENALPVQRLRQQLPISKPSAEQLSRFAAISDEDIERSRSTWKSDAPARFKELLDAEPVIADDEPKPVSSS